MISSEYNESVDRDSVKKKSEKSTKLVQGNQMMNQSDGVSLKRMESREFYKGADRLRRDERAR